MTVPHNDTVIIVFVTALAILAVLACLWNIWKRGVWGGGPK